MLVLQSTVRLFSSKKVRERARPAFKNTKLSPTTAQHLVGVKTVKKTILGGEGWWSISRIIKLAVSNSALKVRSQKAHSIKKKMTFCVQGVIRGQFGCSYKDSEISFQVPCLRHPEPKTFFSYTTTTTRGQDIHPQTTNRSTLNF